MLAQSSVRRSWLNSWLKCRPRQGTHFRWLQCKPLDGRQLGLCLSSSPLGQGGIQILATATGAEAVVDVPVIISDKLQQSFVESVEVPQTQFIDSMVGFPVASQRQGSECKLYRRRRFARCSSWIGTRPSLCNDRAGWSRQFSLEVQQVQFLPGCGRPCGLAGRPGVPGKAGRCLRSAHR